MQIESLTEKKILKAATEVFLEKGKDGARMQEIADRAGINKSLLHYYFRSKNRLYEMVFRQEFEHFWDEFLESIQDSPDIREFLRIFVSNYIERIAQNPKILQFAFWEIRQGGKLASKILRKKFGSGKRRKNKILERIEKAVSNGEIRAVDPLHFLLNLVGMCLYPFFARPIIETIFPHQRVLSKEFLQKRKYEILDLIWNGVCPEKNAKREG